MAKLVGDVHLTWENEAHLEVAESKGELEIVYPLRSIRAEPYVAIVDANFHRKGTQEAARAYLQFLYTDEAQDILGRHFYRPTSPALQQKYASALPALPLFPVTATGCGWEGVQGKFFAEGAIFDQLYAPRTH
jgi:sulfate transport system substrate-binding protein